MECNMKTIKIFACLFVITTCALAAKKDNLFPKFSSPPAQARPFVRWWWNGNCIRADEIRREIAVMDEAGIGGFEINPIAHPGGPNADKCRSLEWLSPKWNRMVKVAVQEARRRGMIPDIIVGSGWPFGGEFLKPNQTTRKLYIKTIPVKGPQKYTLNIAEILKKERPRHGRAWKNAPQPELHSALLAPADIDDIGQCLDVTDHLEKNGKLTVDVPDGKFNLHLALIRKSFIKVTYGAPGAMGPVLDHYNSKAVRLFLERMSVALNREFDEKFGGPIRAVFCDSIELSAANWTGDIEREFADRRGYELKPWLPFVADFSRPVKAGKELTDLVMRVRYDFSKTLVELFHERFTHTYHQWCNKNGALSRFQAYGSPWLLGILDGYLIPDIPETNNWLFSTRGGYRHGYVVWTKYASSAGHLAGQKIISTEAMTNIRGVFRTTLEKIKAADDMNFLMGVSSSVLHGFSYSPPDAGFPGWVRYGTYFNEKNTWWPHFPRWSAYNARLSAVWQETEPVAQIAVLAPRADTWRQHGLQRTHFQTQPWYAHRIWEPISRCGATAEFISENVLRHAKFEGGEIRYGPAGYQAIVVAGAQTLEPTTAKALLQYAESGGKIAFIEHIPSRSPGLKNAAENDKIVKDAIGKCLRSQNVFEVDSPGEKHQPEKFTAWTDQMMERLDIKRSVRFDKPDPGIYQVHRRKDGRDIFFFVNTQKSRKTFSAGLSATSGRPWRWDPETGTRSPFPTQEDTKNLRVVLDPLESLLLVYQSDEADKPPAVHAPPADNGRIIQGAWITRFKPFRGKPFERDDFELVNLGAAEDKKLSTFAGTVVYQKTVNIKDRKNGEPCALGVSRRVWLDLGRVHGVSRVTVNGEDMGCRWYGRHVYPIGNALKKGDNDIRISVTTTLFNYANSLKDNPVAKRWTSYGNNPEPAGMLGPVMLIP